MDAPTASYVTACRGCHGVCQVRVDMAGERVLRVAGVPDSPTSRGFACAKARAAVELLYHPDRVTRPLRRVGPRGGGGWEPVSWDEALDLMAGTFDRIRRDSGPEHVALAQGTGRPYTEFTARFIHAFGSPNFVSPGHMCYLPRVIASSITLGGLPVADVYGFGGRMPACVLVFGCNTMATGSSDGMCGSMLQRAMDQADRVIVVDPRRTRAAASAQQWLQLRPGSECALTLAMIQTILAEGLHDADFVEHHCHGFDRLAAHVAPCTPEWAAPITRLSAQAIREAARTFAVTRPGVVQWGNGIDTSVNMFQTARALLILMAVTGNIDRPGSMALWVPPAAIHPKSPLVDHDVLGDQFLSPEQKGRMIGAGRFPFAPGCHPPAFWQAVVEGRPYRPRALWLVGTNPLVTGTQNATIEAALRDHLEFTVASDFFLTPTARLADLVLPAATWLEQEDVVSFHKVWCVLARRKLAQVGEVRDDRDVILDLARRLGLDAAFPWPDRRAYLDWVLEPSGLDFGGFLDQGILLGQMRYEKFRDQGFRTPTGKFELYSTIMERAGRPPLPVYVEPPLSPASALARDYPLILMAGNKLAPFFHSEGRQLPSLRKLHPDPEVRLHPDTAAGLGLADGDWAWVESPHGRARLKVKTFDGLAPDVVDADHGWWLPEAPAPYHAWKEHNINQLFGGEHFDPDCGAEPLKCSLCRVVKA